jgi:hypothetical protein
MDEKEDKMIRAVCPRYACWLCRTKTGWPHQRWCRLSTVTQPLCADCRYYSAGKVICAYPALRKGGAADNEKAEYTL